MKEKEYIVTMMHPNRSLHTAFILASSQNEAVKKARAKARELKLNYLYIRRVN